MRTVGFLVLTLALAGSARAGTPFGGDDTGFVPPTKSAFLCAAKAQMSAAKMVVGISACHAKLALAALAGSSTSDEQCEQDAVGKFLGQTSNAIAKYNCPSCLIANINLTPYANQVETALDAANGDVYCAGTTPLGDDDAGFAPPDLPTFKCEAVVGKNLGKLRRCLVTCHTKYAKAAMAGGSFDEEACEQSDPIRSCRARFNRTRDKTAPICPPCLDAAAQDALAGQVEGDVDGTNDTFYCASPGGAFLDSQG